MTVAASSLLHQWHANYVHPDMPKCGTVADWAGWWGAGSDPEKLEFNTFGGLQNAARRLGATHYLFNREWCDVTFFFPTTTTGYDTVWVPSNQCLRNDSLLYKLTSWRFSDHAEELSDSCIRSIDTPLTRMERRVLTELRMALKAA